MNVLSLQKLANTATPQPRRLRLTTITPVHIGGRRHQWGRVDEGML